MVLSHSSQASLLDLRLVKRSRQTNVSGARHQLPEMADDSDEVIFFPVLWRRRRLNPKPGKGVTRL